jgi:organic radical activating enzyme
MSNNNCVLAWTHTSAEPLGTCRSCCIAREHIKHDDGTIYSLADETISEILNSKYMKNLRQDMREGKYPSNCNTCWEDESKGKESKRQFYNNLMLNQYNLELDWDKEPEQPVDLQIAISNVCNLKCRTCTAVYSSKWVKEAKDRKMSTWTPKTRSDVHNFETSKFWTDIDNWSKSVRRLEIMGGEPFYTKEFKKLVNHLIDNGSSKNISMNLSTNGTIYDDDLLDKILTNFNGLGFNISIDGIEDHFDYIRHGNNWKNVKSNLDKFHTLLTKGQEKYNENGRWKLSIGVTITISNLNFYYLREIHEFFEKNYPGFKVWNNSVYFPRYYSTNNIPDKVKNLYLDKISNPEKHGLSAWSDEKYKNDILPIVNHAAEEYDNDTWRSFVNETMEADAYRKEKFEETFPELFKIVSFAWDRLYR